ncbi:MAG TPA: GNAT family N-acetyltransferase [Thermoanaerobaculia bacterium]|nr:GNAT family N-acetyltransferase [Thermoanaerobaculia bacterium]
MGIEEVEEEAILTLLRRSLGDTAFERSFEFWRWKHRENPFGPSPGLAAMAGGRPVALRVFLRWVWCGRDGPAPAVRAVDTATDPEWQRRGLFRRLTLELVESLEGEGVAFVFNTPNRKSRRGYLAMGWSDVGRLPLMVRMHRPWRMGTRLLGRRTPAPAVPPPPLPAPLRPIDGLLAEPALPRFLERWAPGEGRWHTPRDVRYLSWRYASCPAATYRAAWRLAGGSGAVLVARIRDRRGLAELSLSEVLASADTTGREALGELLDQVDETGEHDYCVAMAATPSLERDVLARKGFLSATPVAPRLTVRRLADNASGPDPGRMESWRPAIGDLELF